MAEYIEREAVLKMQYWEGCGHIRYGVVDVADIEKMPAADVVEVKHGRWEHLEQGWVDLWRCTACGDEWTFEYDPTDADTKVNYCPNCGARMDGE